MMRLIMIVMMTLVMFGVWDAEFSALRVWALRCTVIAKTPRAPRLKPYAPASKWFAALGRGLSSPQFSGRIFPPRPLKPVIWGA